MLLYMTFNSSSTGVHARTTLLGAAQCAFHSVAVGEFADNTLKSLRRVMAPCFPFTPSHTLSESEGRGGEDKALLNALPRPLL